MSEDRIGPHWEWLTSAPDRVQGEFVQEIEQLEKELKKLKHKILALQDGKMISVVWLKVYLLGPSIPKRDIAEQTSARQS